MGEGAAGLIHDPSCAPILIPPVFGPAFRPRWSLASSPLLCGGLRGHPCPPVPFDSLVCLAVGLSRLVWSPVLPDHSLCLPCLALPCRACPSFPLGAGLPRFFPLPFPLCREKKKCCCPSCQRAVAIPIPQSSKFPPHPRRSPFSSRPPPKTLSSSPSRNNHHAQIRPRRRLAASISHRRGPCGIAKAPSSCAPAAAARAAVARSAAAPRDEPSHAVQATRPLRRRRPTALPPGQSSS